jgi:hypothetical protein
MLRVGVQGVVLGFITFVVLHAAFSFNERREGDGEEAPPLRKGDCFDFFVFRAWFGLLLYLDMFRA